MRVVLTIKCEVSVCKVARLTDKLGKKNSSIWNQTKEELVEITRRELGMTVTLASNETVLTLRELIRRNREMYKANADPLSKAPKGLGNMNKEALLEEGGPAEVIVAHLPEPEVRSVLDADRVPVVPQPDATS